jgi:hypothetical protein
VAITGNGKYKQNKGRRGEAIKPHMEVYSDTPTDEARQQKLNKIWTNDRRKGGGRKMLNKRCPFVNRIVVALYGTIIIEQRVNVWIPCVPSTRMGW